jgi:putative membrane protein insertion efficiency factor
MIGKMLKNDDRAGKLPQAPAQRKPSAAALLGLIRLYQLSFAFFLGRRCRHLPSCSHYAAEAIGRHGAWAGFLLGLFRLMRCHPWGTEGFDPVPDNVPSSPFAIAEFWRKGKQRRMAEE